MIPSELSTSTLACSRACGAVVVVERFRLVLRSCQAADDVREDASMVEVCQLHRCVEAKSASEGFPVVGRDSHVLARTDLADVGGEVNGVPLMSSNAE